MTVAPRPREPGDEPVRLPDLLPVLPLKGVVVFPLAISPLAVGQPRSVQLVDDAMRGNRLLALVAQREENVEQPAPGDLYRVGTVAVIYLLYLWIILPVLRLQDGLRRMAAREFSLRLPVETRDEFGTLSEGFNRMAGELQGLYRDLEARVAQKTAELERQNRDLETLYDMAAFLNQASDADTMARGFLARVMRQFDAEGGSVRVLDPRHGRLHLLASAGLPAALAEAASCAAADACEPPPVRRQPSLAIPRGAGAWAGEAAVRAGA